MARATHAALGAGRPEYSSSTRALRVFHCIPLFGARSGPPVRPSRPPPLYSTMPECRRRRRPYPAAAALASVLAATVVVVGTASGANVTVDTSLGPVVGTAGDSAQQCATFYGVRYAAPPTGANRFRPPQPAAAWSDPQPAMRVGKSCLQTFGDSFINFPLWLEYLAEKLHLGMEPMSEDCLFLNVFSPRLPPAAAATSLPAAAVSTSSASTPHGDGADGDDLLPVLVWFHGGSNMGGSGDLQSELPLYDGKVLCAAGEPAVIVTVNYRLGIFGFLAHDELLATEGTAGNMGLQDQRAALEWVAANAARFGGDPARVTIFGESAGAGDTAVHLSTARSAHLFSAGIMQSGGLWVSSYNESRAQSQAVVDVVGCGGNVSSNDSDGRRGSAAGGLECLRALPAEKLLLGQRSAGWTGTNPCADGYEYPLNTTQRAVFRAGAFAAKPMMVGTNQNESALFKCGGAEADSVVDAASFRAAVAGELGRPATTPALDRIAELYNATTSYGGDWRRAFIDTMTDLHFYCGSRAVLDATAAKGQPAWQYRLAHTPLLMDVDKCWGTPHMSDLFLLWGQPMFKHLLTTEDRALGLRMRLRWKSFAANHTAAPGGGDSSGWPAYGGAAERRYAVFDTPADSEDAQWKRAQCDYLDELVEQQQQ